MVIFHSYVSLPEGNYLAACLCRRQLPCSLVHQIYHRERREVSRNSRVFFEPLPVLLIVGSLLNHWFTMSIPFQYYIYIHIPKHINYVHEFYKFCYYWPRGVESKVYIPTISAYGCIYIYISGCWFGTLFIFPYIGNFIIPTDFHIFQRGGSTTNQTVYIYMYIYIIPIFYGYSHWKTTPASIYM